jgi:ribosomal protein S18 acetylase RimI-like enzyme
MLGVLGIPVKRLTAPYRRAMSEDAPKMAELVNIASHGLALYLWGKLAGAGESPWDVGLKRARRGIGGFAYRNTVVREAEGRIAACLVSYPLRDAPQLYDQVPIMLAPMFELENIVPGTWFVNVLATYAEHRGKGYGTELLHIAEVLAHDAQCGGMSLILSDANAEARRLYERHGYGEHATRPIVKEDWEHSGQNWVLLVKAF